MFIFFILLFQIQIRHFNEGNHNFIRIDPESGSTRIEYDHIREHKTMSHCILNIKYPSAVMTQTTFNIILYSNKFEVENRLCQGSYINCFATEQGVGKQHYRGSTTALCRSSRQRSTRDSHLVVPTIRTRKKALLVQTRFIYLPLD